MNPHTSAMKIRNKSHFIELVNAMLHIVVFPSFFLCTCRKHENMKKNLINIMNGKQPKQMLRGTKYETLGCTTLYGYN